MAKKYKPHMMYCKDGSATKAMTYKEHLALKKKGCGHKKPKGKGSPMKMDANRDVDPSPVDPKTGKKVARKRGMDHRKEK